MKNKIRICPKCKSKNIKINMNVSTAWGAPQPYKCENCGFESYLILEKNKKESKK